MALHDTFAWMGYGRTWRVRWFRTRRGLDRAARDRPEPGARVRARYRRRLALIERRLAADSPVLSSRLTMFNQLTAGEPPIGVEQLSPWAWPRPRRVHLVVLVALAAIVALCVAVSAQVRPEVGSCPVAAAAGMPSHALMRDPVCPAYANTRQ